MKQFFENLLDFIVLPGLMIASGWMFVLCMTGKWP